MKLSSAFTVAVLFALSFIMLSGGCSKGPTPEENQADSTLILAKSHLDGGEYRKGRQFLLSALALDLRLSRTQQLAEEFNLLGRLYTLLAEFDSAMLCYTKAIEQYKSLTDRTNARAALLEVASLHRQMGEERVAYSMYAEALRLADVFKDPSGMCEIQFSMLPTCRALENTEDLENALNNLLRAYVASGDQKMQSRTHFETALTFIQRQEYRQAVEPLLRALTLASQAKDSLFSIRILSTLAATYDRGGNTQQAFDTYTDAITRSDHTADSQDIRLEMLIRVGNIYLREMQFADAGRFYRAALSSAINRKNRLAEGYLFLQLGHCALGDGRVEEAYKSIQSAIELFAPTGYTPGIAFAHASLGIAYQRSGRLNDAVGCFKTAVEWTEHSAIRSTNVYAECEDVALRQLSCYDYLVELLLQLGRTDDAFWYAERNAEHTLQQKLFSLDLQTRNPTANAMLSRLRRAHAVHVGAERQLEKMLECGPDDRVLRDAILTQIKKTTDVFQDLSEAIIKAEPSLGPAVRYDGVSIADVQHQLPPGIAVLRSIPTARSVYSFAITKSNSPVQLAAIDRNRLHSLITEYLLTIRNLVALADSPAVSRKTMEQHLQEQTLRLYAVFVRPVETALAGVTDVIALPDGELPLVPIHALRKGGAGTPYCIEQFPVSYLPSLAMLRSGAPPTFPVHDVVGVGHAGATSWDVEYELRDIRAFYKDARLYFGQQASLATLQREHGDVLHLALDFRYSDRSPENAHMILPDGKARGVTKEIPWGGLLSTTVFPTILVSDLHGDSIGVGQLLPSLLLANGSSAIIVNMLPSSRKAKKYFGEYFYTALLAGKSTNAAFRQAMLEMIRNKETVSPFAWAPFSIWGK
jgi:tetratricopeptide (TPR) repeat protein